ncbi:hypothetical protein RsoP1IDN_31 [Ralstonia phage RsoP1IDN]|uniref:Internal virion protein n=1 Tax=Ralstonia phage RsoP1IDN TaxID=2060091 RepID=A0A2P0VPH0_9CAUD|nr:internal virion protein [Ralstonia phage RsoP1IDN]AUG85432.1 hypothetical protein RsoP1IDN_31 [Ralstonia phage RsoP1IDN]
MWMAAIGAVMGMANAQAQKEEQAAQQYAQKAIDQARADAANTVNTANAEGANKIRYATNDFEAAQAALSTTTRSIANQQKLQAFGEQYNALQVNIARQSDQMLRGRLVDQLQAASNLGALRADAASRGVGGSSAEIMRSVAALNFGSRETQSADMRQQLSYDQALQRSGMIRTAILSQDLTVDLPSLDYGFSSAPTQTAGTYFQSNNGVRQAIISGLPALAAAAGEIGGALAGAAAPSGFYGAGAKSAADYSLTFGLGGSSYQSTAGTSSLTFGSGTPTSGMFTSA